MNIGASVLDPDHELYGLMLKRRDGNRTLYLPGEALTLEEIMAVSLLWDRRSKYGRPTVETERRAA